MFAQLLKTFWTRPDPLVFLKVHQQLAQVPRHLGEVLPVSNAKYWWELDIGPQNHLERRVIVLRLEGWLPRKQLVDDTAEGPEISGGIRDLGEENFRGDVAISWNGRLLLGPHEGAPSRLGWFRCAHLRPTKIAQLEMVVFVEEQVKGLEVAMSNTLAMDVLKDDDNLSDVMHSKGVGQEG